MSYQQTIYDQLRKGGISEAGALGILGNLDCESNCEPYRLQGDFSPYRTQSKAYVQSIMNGLVTKAQFCDGRVGKFIAQWAYPTRQAALWDFWKARGGAIDDAAMQADFVLEELKGYPGLLSFLQKTTDIFTAVSRVCREYERPAINNIDARFDRAKKIQYEIDLNAWEDGGKDDPIPTPTPAPAPLKPDALELRTIDKNCSGFDEVWLLKALLLCRGYEVDTKNAFAWDSTLTDCVKAFQTHHSLGADGIVGSKTWSALLERG